MNKMKKEINSKIGQLQYLSIFLDCLFVGNGRVGRIIMFKECLKNNITPFIILDKDKFYYYRGLKEFEKEKGYLMDTCLNAQGQYQELVEKFL